MKPSKTRNVISPVQPGSPSRPHCSHRRDASLMGAIRTAVDDSGSLAITAWTCASCGDLVEEIQILSRQHGTQPAPIRYVVASPASQARIAAVTVQR